MYAYQPQVPHSVRNDTCLLSVNLRVSVPPWWNNPPYTRALRHLPERQANHISRPWMLVERVIAHHAASAP